MVFSQLNIGPAAQQFRRNVDHDLRRGFGNKLFAAKHVIDFTRQLAQQDGQRIFGLTDAGFKTRNKCLGIF